MTLLPAGVFPRRPRFHTYFGRSECDVNLDGVATGERASVCLSANPLCPFKALASIPPRSASSKREKRPSRSLAHFGAGIPPCLFLPSLSSELIYGLPEKLHNFKRGNERGLHLGKAELEGALLQIGGGEAEDDMFTGGRRAWSLCQNHEREGGRAPRGKIICGRLRDP